MPDEKTTTPPAGTHDPELTTKHRLLAIGRALQALADLWVANADDDQVTAALGELLEASGLPGLEERDDSSAGDSSVEQPTTPRGAGASTCRSCNRPVLWVRTEGGKRMPLDVKRLTVMVADEKMLPGDEVVYRVAHGYMSHFATCPHASAHRNTKR